MPADFEILGLTVVNGTNNWEQNKDEAVDVSAYSEAAIMLTAFGGTIANKPGTTSVWVQGAVDNVDERYSDLALLATVTEDVLSDIPDTFYICMKGPGAGGMADFPGFPRYLRIRVDSDDNASSLSFDVRAIMKP